MHEKQKKGNEAKTAKTSEACPGDTGKVRIRTAGSTSRILGQVVESKPRAMGTTSDWQPGGMARQPAKVEGGIQDASTAVTATAKEWAQQ